MGCGTTQAKGEDTTIEEKMDSFAYEVVFTKQFHPELYASEFIGKCQKTMQSLFTFQYQTCDIRENEPKIGFSRSISQVSIDRSMISEIMDMKSTNDLGQIPEDSRLGFDDAISDYIKPGGFARIEESDTQWSVRDSQVGGRLSESNTQYSKQLMEGKSPQKITLYTDKITFFNMYMLIRKHYSYFNEYDLYQFYWYVTQPITGEVRNLGALFQSFKEKNEYASEEIINMELYLKLMYLISPDQGKNILQSPLNIFFYYCDDMFNDRVKISNFISYLQQKFPNKNLTTLITLLQKSGSVIDRATFEMSIIDKMKYIMDKEEIRMPQLSFSYKRENLSHYLQKWQGGYRKKRKQLEDYIAAFEQRAQEMGTLRNNSRGFKMRDRDIDI